MSLTQKQLTQVNRIADALDKGPVELLEYLRELEDKIDEVKKLIPDLDKVLVSVRGKDGNSIKGDAGYTPKKGVDYVDGKDYTITEADYGKIAKKVNVPIVEKKIIVEKTETIIEQPIIKTEIVKEIIVDKTDTPEEILAKINELPIEPEFQIDATHIKNLPRPLLGTVGGGRVGLQVRSSGAKIGTKANEVNFVGFTVTNVSGVPTITGNGGIGSAISVTGTVNDSNKSFTAASAFTYVIINGAIYREGHGFSKSVLAITLDNAVGTGGDIYCL